MNIGPDRVHMMEDGIAGWASNEVHEAGLGPYVENQEKLSENCSRWSFSLAGRVRFSQCETQPSSQFTTHRETQIMSRETKTSTAHANLPWYRSITKLRFHSVAQVRSVNEKSYFAA